MKEKLVMMVQRVTIHGRVVKKEKIEQSVYRKQTTHLQINCLFLGFHLKSQLTVLLQLELLLSHADAANRCFLGLGRMLAVKILSSPQLLTTGDCLVPGHSAGHSYWMLVTA